MKVIASYLFLRKKVGIMGQDPLLDGNGSFLYPAMHLNELFDLKY
jgi:hypothetical protein